jgi:hypothetical protein
VSFDPDPPLAFEDWDRPCNHLWRAFKRGSKMDEYLGLFSLKSRDLRTFRHGSGTSQVKNGISSGVEGFAFPRILYENTFSIKMAAKKKDGFRNPGYAFIFFQM